MKMPERKRFYYLITTVAVFVFLIAGGTFLAEKLLHLDSYKEQILAELQKNLNRTVTYDKGTFSLNLGPSFAFTNVLVREKDGSQHFITAEKVTIQSRPAAARTKKSSTKGNGARKTDDLCISRQVRQIQYQ